jgi:type VI secretion system protein ImpJ
LARYYLTDQNVRDVTQEGGDNLPMSVGKLRIKLMLETDDMDGYAYLGLMRIAESRNDKTVLLDDKYIPTVLDCNRDSKLSAFLSGLIGLLHHRAESIAGRLADVRSGGTAEVSDYMMLQQLNRHELRISHLAKIQGLHPINFFFELLEILGGLSTFFSKTKRPPELPAYLHGDLQVTFTPVMEALHQGLSTVYEQTAIALNLAEKKYGIRVAQISDATLLNSAVFVLAARAAMAEDQLRSRLPAQLKIGPVELIRQLVNAAMPGIPLKALPVAPRQIPFHSGYSYFELEKNSPLWKELQHSGGVALHVGGDFPSLEFELWAIRQ